MNAAHAHNRIRNRLRRLQRQADTYEMQLAALQNELRECDHRCNSIGVELQTCTDMQQRVLLEKEQIAKRARASLIRKQLIPELNARFDKSKEYRLRELQLSVGQNTVRRGLGMVPVG